jgi:hypothetical protein
MQAHLAWLSKVPWALEILATGHTPRHGRLQDTEENRAWWQSEFGIAPGA